MLEKYPTMFSQESHNTHINNALKHTFNPSTSFSIKMLWGYPLSCWIIFSLSVFFINPVLPRVVISIILGYFPWREVVNKMYAGGHKHLRTQLLVLLQVLCTSVSSGYSISKSLMLVRPVIEHTFGRKSSLIKPLTAIENNLKMHMDLEEALNIFADSIDFPEIAPVFNSLAISGKIGNNTLSILRSSCEMLSELNAVQNDINAQNAGKNAEAIMLCLMPFGITMALNQMGGGYLSQAKSTRVGAIILAIAFGMCVISSSLLFKYMSNSDNGSFNGTKSKKNKDDKNTTLIIVPLIRKILPTNFLTSRHELFNELYLNPESAYENYLRSQIILFTSTTVISAITLAIIHKPVLWSLVVGICISLFRFYDVKKLTIQKREELMKDIPLFMCLTCTLLEAGLQLPKAITICSKAFRKNPSLAYEISGLRAMLISGVSAPDAIEKLSLRIQIPEAQSALLLIARYGRLGTPEVLNLLTLQANACWNLCRNAARKKQEREALSLLLPMTLDFICVLLVATAPAIISLGI